MRRPVIIDCDPGVDDALAILLALSSDKIDIRAITTVAGNQTIDKTTRNALNIAGYAGFTTKVAMGASKPLLRELVTAEFVHGESGTGNAVFPESGQSLYDKNAVETIYEEAQLNEKLHIIALGPLTNIASVLLKHPDIKDKIEHITLMGGAAYGGNYKPAAEFNIYVDPEAARVVFESGVPITMIGLDVTHKAFIYEDEIMDIVSCPSRIKGIVSELLYSTLNICRSFGYDFAIMHDPTAVAAVIDPSLITTRTYHVDVETKGEFTTGKTVVDVYNVLKKGYNAEVGFEVDRERFVQLIKGMMMKYGE